MNKTLYEKLVKIASTGCLAAYSEVGPLLGLNMGRPDDRNALRDMLDEISTFEHSQGRPLLSAVVVHKEGDSYGSPGKGFFKMARRLNRLPPTGDEDAFWAEEVNNVFKEWERNGGRD